MTHFLGHVIINHRDIKDIKSFDLDQYLNQKLERFNERTKVPEYLTISECSLYELTRDPNFPLSYKKAKDQLSALLDHTVIKEEDYAKGYSHYFNLFEEFAVILDSKSNITKALRKQVAQPKYDYYTVGGGYIHSEWAFPLKKKANPIEFGLSKCGFKKYVNDASFELRSRSICARTSNIDFDKMQEYFLRENHYMWNCIESVIGNKDLPYAGEDPVKERYMYNLLVNGHNILYYVNNGLADDLLGHNRIISNENISKRALCPAAAIVKDDKWYDRPYPLWGKDSKHQNIDLWLKTYRNILDSCDPNDYVLILQFHI